VKIADKSVLVTGANRGIGQALVTEALRRGAMRVYAGARRPVSHPDGRVTPAVLDVTDAGLYDLTAFIGQQPILGGANTSTAPDIPRWFAAVTFPTPDPSLNLWAATPAARQHLEGATT
jgi:NAD(P)-dependent dehydrogenase (short-subunit alcohol dehydrogenase family)